MNSTDTIIQKWDEILSYLKEEYDIVDIQFDTWLRPMKVYSVQDDILYILVPPEHKVTINYINKKYQTPLMTAVADKTGIVYQIKFIAEEDSANINDSDANSSKSKKPSYAIQNNKLDPDYTFSKFVVGSSNRFAHSASLAVAEAPGEVYNPLYIHGGPGLGKTHLMQSIGHYILEQNPDSKVIYVTSEEFTNEVIESIRNGNASSMTKFRDKYRTADVLMVDDVQFIIGKESTQEEFFHTFNALKTQGKQIILTSDKPPKEMVTLEERIRSRFEWGLIADIGAPEYETRMAILRKKSENENFSVDDQILNYIASNIKSNVRELEGAIKRLLACHNLEGKEITMEIAQKELQNIITPDKPKEITMQLIVEVVSEHYGISMDQMISKDRSKNISKPRQIAMYLCKEMTSEPLDSIGTLLGRRDHSTILHGIKKIQEDLSKDSALKTNIDIIKKKINPN